MPQQFRILITGGSGFIGSHLARAEIEAGNEVYLLLRAESPQHRLADLTGRYVPIRGDLREPADVRRAVEAARPNIVYHLASYGTFVSQTDRATTLKTNLIGTINLLDALDGHDYQALVHAGSSSEYGHKNKPMQPTDVLEPRTDYGVMKAAATLFCQAEAFRGWPVVTVRIFSAYGPMEDSSRIASYVMGCCSRGETARVTAAAQPRDFIYVDDVISLVRISARAGLRGNILHAGSGQRQTVRDMVETICEVAGAARVEYGAMPMRADEPDVWLADIESTTALTGWKPAHNLKAGVKKMWTWYQAKGLVERTTERTKVNEGGAHAFV